jgi:hypothetical protein
MLAPYLRYVAMYEGNLPHIEHDPEILRITKDLRVSGNLGFASTVFSSSSFSCDIINGSIFAFERFKL